MSVASLDRSKGTECAEEREIRQLSFYGMKKLLRADCECGASVYATRDSDSTRLARSL